MPAYLARLVGDHELVGFFAVADDAELFWLIDECCDPGDVEITELGSGGIYWGTTIPNKVPVSFDENEEPEYEGIPSDARLSEQWNSVMISDDETLIWRPIPIVQDLD